MRLGHAVCVFALLVLLAACRPAHRSDDVLPHVSVKKLDPGKFLARYRISVQAQPGVSVTDHTVALLTIGNSLCVDRSYEMAWEGIDWQASALPPPRGHRLALVMACRHDRIPNHQKLAAQESFDVLPLADGARSIEIGSQYRGKETDVEISERLAGNLLRRAFAEECNGAVSVENLQFITQANDAFDRPTDGNSMTALLQFRCAKAAPEAGDVPADPRP